MGCGNLVSRSAALVRIPGVARARQEQRQRSSEVLAIDDVERVYNILQWYGTLVADARPHASPRLCESLVCPDKVQLATIPFRDDALVIGDLNEDALEVLK